MYRIKNEQSKLSGVCLGLSDNLAIDVTLVRVFFIILFFTPIPIFTIYLILTIFSPNKLEVINQNLEPVLSNNNNKQTINMANQSKNDNMIGGIILIILGAIFSFKSFFDINLFSYIKNVWPLVLIGLGVWIILKDKDKGNTNYTDNNDSSKSTNY